MWKDIKGYEGLYQISDTGEVKALQRTVINKKGNLQSYPEKILKPELSKQSLTSYARVTICKNHKTKRIPVHRLVAETYIPNPENKPCINHIDNNGLNNMVNNLEWCTHSENMIHAQKQNRLYNSQSKGGTQAGKLAKERMLNNINSISNTTISSWLVLGTNTFQRAKKTYTNCVCKCGKVQDIEIGRLFRNEVTMCKTCAKVKDIV